MASEKKLSARKTAWKTLNISDLSHHDTAVQLGLLLDQTDRGGQATDIVMGVVRHRATLDRVLKKCATLDPARVKTNQWNLLRIGVYELAFCPRTAEYAILNEAADLARGGGSAKSAGFINAVLRNVQRAIESRQAAITEENLGRIVPHDRINGCLFKEKLLPDFSEQPEQYLSTAYSMPPALVHSWIQAYGADTAKEICLASNRTPSVILQPNTLKAATEQVADQLQKEAADSRLVIHDGAIGVRSIGKLNRTAAYLDGLFYVQDMTAALTAQMVQPQPGWIIADLCAAPGGKAAAMAIRMRDQGMLLAGDIDAERLKRVRENARRLGLQCIEVVPAGRIEETVHKQKRLDAILLDVPCSNTGVLARRVEARWRWSERDLPELIEVQQRLLDLAASMARSETRIVYSTCSIQPQENEQQTALFLERHRKFRLERQQLTFPSLETPDAFDHDGGFAAVMIHI